MAYPAENVADIRWKRILHSRYSDAKRNVKLQRKVPGNYFKRQFLMKLSENVFLKRYCRMKNFMRFMIP